MKFALTMPFSLGINVKHSPPHSIHASQTCVCEVKELINKFDYYQQD